MNKIKNSKIYNYLSENVLIIFLISICIALGVARPLFLSMQNITNVLIQVSINALLATGMTFVILTGGIDLSVGAVAAFSGVLSATVMKMLPIDISIILVLLISLFIAVITGLLFGNIVGLCVSKLNVAPFISTLVTLSVARGFAFIISGGKPIFELQEAFKFIGQYRIADVFPLIIILVVFVMVLADFVLKKTAFGRHVHSVGSNSDVSFLSGVNVNKIKICVYIICSFMAALSGIILASKLGTGQPSAAEGYELNAIAAVVLGGTSLNGGKGSIGKTVIGVLTIGVINNGMSLLLINSYWQKVIMGIIILLAVILDQYRLKSRNKQGKK